MSHTHTIVAQREIIAPIEDIWQAFSDADRLAHWFTTEAEHDFRVGGRYSNGDGDQGEYLEIIPNSRIQFSWEQPDYEPGSTVSIDFIPLATDRGNTWVVQVTHEGIACDDQSDLDIGWNWALDSLVQYLRSGIGMTFEEWAAHRGSI